MYLYIADKSTVRLMLCHVNVMSASELQYFPVQFSFGMPCHEIEQTIQNEQQHISIHKLFLDKPG